MTPYTAPLEEMRFALRELADLQHVTQLPDADALADIQLTDAVLEQAAAFAREVLAPLDQVPACEDRPETTTNGQARPDPREAYRRFVEAGWNNMALPAEHGGQGLPLLLCTLVRELFFASNRSFGRCLDLTAAVVEALVTGGDPALKARFLPKLVSGECTATLPLTESRSGAGGASPTLRAVPQGDGGWRLFGQQRSTRSGGQDLTHNQVHLVLAQTAGSPTQAPGSAVFLVPRWLPRFEGQEAPNDLLCRTIEHPPGDHDPSHFLLVCGTGGAGAVGWKLDGPHCDLQLRIHPGLPVTAASERASQRALACAQDHDPPGATSLPVGHHSEVRRLLRTMRSQTQAMRALDYLITGAQDVAARHPDAHTQRERQQFLDLVRPVFNAWATETAVRVHAAGLRVQALTHATGDCGAPPARPGGPGLPVDDDITTRQAQDWASTVLPRNGAAALRAWLRQLRATQSLLSARETGVLPAMGLHLGAAADALQQAAEWAVTHHAHHPDEVLAGSLPLMRAFGVVAGGWQMARAALAAQRRLDDGSGGKRFLRAKMASAWLYVAQVLPQAIDLAAAAQRGRAVSLRSRTADGALAR